jgi:hypothetical protein
LSFDVYGRFLRIQAMTNDERMRSTDELISMILSQSFRLRFYANHNKMITKEVKKIG